MNTYIVTRKSDLKEVYRYQADAPIEWSGMEFATHDHTVFVDTLPPPVTPTGRVMTKLAFRRLFTLPERQLIDEFNAGFESSPTLTAEQKRAVRTAQADFAEANDIDTADPDTIAGVQLYATLGLIAAGRAQEILNA